MLLVVLIALMWVALSLVGQRLTGRALGVKAPIRPLLRFAPDTSLKHRVFVRAGGALFTWFLFFLVAFAYGTTRASFSARVDVRPGLAADDAGMKTGDLVLDVDGVPVSDFAELTRQVQLAAEKKVMNVKRGDETLRLEVVPRDGLIGVKALEAMSPRVGDSVKWAALAVFDAVPTFARAAMGSVARGKSFVQGGSAGSEPGRMWAGALIFSAAIAWWLSVFAEVLAFLVNQPRASRTPS